MNTRGNTGEVSDRAQTTHSPRMHTQPAATLANAGKRSECGLTFVAITALAWGMIDALFFGQGLIAAILCMAGLLYFPLRALQARNDGALLKLRLAKAAICAAAGFAALGMIVYGNILAQARAEALIAAAEQFHAKHGRYPQRLEELVPAFVAAIPKAKYVMIADRFTYFAADSRHSLMYVQVPPFGRRIYTFEDRRWSYLD